jgi:hypothetical protein
VNCGNHLAERQRLDRVAIFAARAVQIVICRRRLGIDDEALNNTEKISDPMLKFLDQQFR